MGALPAVTAVTRRSRVPSTKCARGAQAGASALQLPWPRCTLPAEDLYLSNSVFPLERRIIGFVRGWRVRVRAFL